MDDAALADATSAVDFSSGIYDRAVANAHSVADIGLRIDLCAAPYLRSGADISERADVDIVGHLNSLGYEAWLLHPAAGRIHQLIHHREQARNRGVWIVDPYQSGLDGLFGDEIAAHEHGRRKSLVYIRCIFGIGQERDGALTALLYLGECIDFYRFITLHDSFRESSYLTGCKFHVNYMVWCFFYFRCKIAKNFSYNRHKPSITSSTTIGESPFGMCRTTHRHLACEQIIMPEIRCRKIENHRRRLSPLLNITNKSDFFA